MNWFQENKFLGSFLVGLGLFTVVALWFLFSSRSSFGDASDQLGITLSELNRLQGLNPFPNDANLGKVREQSKQAATALEKLKQDLKSRVLPETPMAPNEFQARLRQVLASITDKARANKVRLPENFFLGFDEYSAALPGNEEAPVLGQQLAQIELLLNILIDARVEALTAFRRVPPTEKLWPAAATPTPSAGRRTAATPTPTPGPRLIERAVVELSVKSSSGPARRAINQIASANQQFFIIRTLHVHNEKDKGPPRAAAGENATPALVATPAALPGAKPGPSQALNFIVGNERIETSAMIELIKFNL